MSKMLLLLLAALLSVVMADDDPCRLWLAPSTMSSEDFPTLGLYAGVAYDVNEAMGPAELGIPLVDFNIGRADQEPVLDILETFFWTADLGGNKWEGNYSNFIAVPGLGTLTSDNPSMANIDWDSESILSGALDDIFETGQANPSRGAVSTYFNYTLRSTKRIEAGMELFVNFDDVWNEDETSQDDPLGNHDRMDYKDADKILEDITAFIQQYDDYLTPKLKKEVLNFLMEDVMGTAAGSRAQEIRSLLPAHAGKLQQVKDMGGTFPYRNPDLVMTPKWLKKHGRCMDKLVAGPSTLPDAGRGAFATRAIKRNQVVAPAPMLHIADEDVFTMYKMNTLVEKSGLEIPVPDYNEPVGKQLILNYCFGHPDSTLLLFPIGSMVSLINHNQEPNARLTWSKMPLEDPVNWRMLRPDEMVEARVGIVMEVVATKDIAPGDEVFIDYGPEWTNAWNQHRSEWNAQHETDSTWPVKAMDLRKIHKTTPFRTQKERQKNDYPSGVETVCLLETGQDGEPSVEDGARWEGPSSLKDFSAAHMHLCQVLERKEADRNFRYNYTVIVQDSDAQVTHVPHYAVTIVDKPYQSDIFTDGAFRHWIGLPEMTVPRAWRNKE